MNELHLYNLIVDSDFKKMAPILSTEESTDLEQEIVYNGYYKPIITWNKTILDGFNQYEICHRWEVPFKVEEIEMRTRDEAIIYICKNTLKKKNLTDEQYRYCIGRLYTAYKTFMLVLYPHQNQYTPEDQRRPGYNSPSGNTTAQMVGEMVFLSSGTVAKYGIFAKAIDTIYDKVPDIAMEMLSGSFHISHDNTIKLAEMSPDEIKVIHDHAVLDGDNRLLHSSIQRSLQQSKERAQRESKRAARKKPEIKQMPKYDPDAEISSLTLTIPTWISSMKRTQSISNFSEASTAALWKLEKKLDALQESIQILQTAIKEEYHE